MARRKDGVCYEVGQADGEVIAPWQMFVLLEVWVVCSSRQTGGWEFCNRALTNLQSIVFSAYGSLR